MDYTLWLLKRKSIIQALERVTDTDSNGMVTLDVTDALNITCPNIIIKELRVREILQYLIELVFVISCTCLYK